MIEPARRKEGLQRLRIGISGLVGVVLLVGLANIVVDNSRRDDALQGVTADAADNSAAAVATDDSNPKEPLAELGVAPAAPAPDSAGQAVVADLQPDPNLRKPMDQVSPAPAANQPAQQQSPRPQN